ncbi:MAG: radical SAM protein [Armatimonadetes bacterium]|nr:radical SAM protein [Armatimonadota bacterium]
METLDVPVRTAAAVLTRRCNLSCGYCSIVRQPLPRELDETEWRQAFVTLDRLGVETLSLTGGEPTLLPFLVRLLEFAHDQTRMRVAMATNGTFPVARAADYARAGLAALIFSVDTLSDLPVDKSSRIKSEAALAHATAYRAAGIPRLIANVLIHRRNLAEVPRTVARLHALGVESHPLLLHTGEAPFWQNRGPDTGFACRPEDQPALQALAAELRAMKRAGVTVDAPEAFLANLPRYAVGLTWQCHPFPRKLRIDADGTLSCCQDIRGARTSTYSVFDLVDEARRLAFRRAWSIDSRLCPGCYYTDIFQAHPEADPPGV